MARSKGGKCWLALPGNLAKHAVTKHKNTYTPTRQTAEATDSLKSRVADPLAGMASDNELIESAKKVMWLLGRGPTAGDNYNEVRIRCIKDENGALKLVLETRSPCNMYASYRNWRPRAYQPDETELCEHLRDWIRHENENAALIEAAEKVLVEA